MRELAMFAGAGGGILGSMLLGHQIVGVNEIAEYPCRTLRQRQIDGALPGFPIWNMDIREFNERIAPSYAGMVDLVSGGFPCQDISCAGKGAGIEGERSGLWKELAETIRIVRPRFAFLENSPMLTIRGLEVVLQDLAEMGYDAEWCCLGASDVGLPHHRSRIWILAYSTSINGHTWDMLEKGIRGDTQREFRRLPSVFMDKERWKVCQGDECVSIFRNPADGLAPEVGELKAIGNGQCPQCMAAAFRILMEAAHA